jgi:tripartite-type tricarboxylate transporter receptor subunit TctC
MLFRLRGLSRSLLLASGIALAGAASAQGTAIKVLVGFPPGGGTDAIARVLADKLKDQLGVPVIVENKAGAGGQLAAQALKAAAPDGNTLFLTHDHSVSILPLVMKNPASTQPRTLWLWPALPPSSTRWRCQAVPRPSR